MMPDNVNAWTAIGAFLPCPCSVFHRWVLHPSLLAMGARQTILDGHLQHFDAEIAGQSSNMIKAALGLHSQVRASCMRRSINAVKMHAHPNSFERWCGVGLLLLWNA